MSSFDAMLYNVTYNVEQSCCEKLDVCVNYAVTTYPASWLIGMMFFEAIMFIIIFWYYEKKM